MNTNSMFPNINMAFGKNIIISTLFSFFNDFAESRNKAIYRTYISCILQLIKSCDVINHSQVKVKDLFTAYTIILIIQYIT
jgi:hypothetical protein